MILPEISSPEIEEEERCILLDDEEDLTLLNMIDSRKKKDCLLPMCRW